MSKLLVILWLAENNNNKKKRSEMISYKATWDKERFGEFSVSHLATALIQSTLGKYIKTMSIPCAILLRQF